jgi:hypothetical protein
MNGQLIVIGVILAALFLAIGCNGPGAGPQPYEYTHTTELQSFEIFENARITGAARSVVATLAQLGYGDMTLAGSEEETPAVTYTLPADAAQGPDTWYIVNFHFLIEFAADTGGGFCDVRAKPGASVQFETLRVNDSPYIRIPGNEPVSATSTRIEVRYYNYMSQSAVSPGENEMTFSFKEYQGAKVKSVTVYSDTAIETTAVSPETAEPPPLSGAYEPFYSVSPELTERLERICLADPAVQVLIEGREYSFTVDGHTVAGKDYNLAMGVRLKDDIGNERFQEWMEGGRQDSDIIREYVGVLNIGYNTEYHLTIDIGSETVSELIEEISSGPGIPELTAEERQRAVTIAMADTTLRQVLAGKEYRLAPEGIGIWHEGETKLGAVFNIQFEETYLLEAELPEYPSGTYHYSGEAGVLMVSVLLEEEMVASVIVLPSPPETKVE